MSSAEEEEYLKDQRFFLSSLNPVSCIFYASYSTADTRPHEILHQSHLYLLMLISIDAEFRPLLSKLMISNPENLIDKDFANLYQLMPLRLAYQSLMHLMMTSAGSLAGGSPSQMRSH